MKAQDLKSWIDSLTDDIEFSYNGKDGAICPISRADISLCYNGDEVTVRSVDAAMSTPFIAGKSLNEICEQIQFG